jgi:hypothetical protein
MELFRAPAGPEQRLHNKPLRRDPTETEKSEPGREKRPRKLHAMHLIHSNTRAHSSARQPACCTWPTRHP